MTFWPAPGWDVWDACVAAGLRCTDDPRNLAPPVVLFEIAEQDITGSAGGGCLIVEGVCVARPLAPAPDNADARKWIWLRAVPVLMPFSAESVEPEDFEDMPGAAVRIQFTYTTSGG